MWAIRTLLSVTMFFLAASAAHAELVVMTSADFGSATTVTFSQFDSPLFTNPTGPLQVGEEVGENIQWVTPSTSVIGNGNFKLGSNGHWTSGRAGYTAMFDDSSMRFDFLDGAVRSVGAFLNYAPGLGPVIIEALGVASKVGVNTVLESYEISSLAPISTPGEENAGEFRGIVRETAEIVAFVVRGASVVLDDLTFSRAPLPPPPSTIQSSAEFSVRNNANGDPQGFVVIDTATAQVGNLRESGHPDVRGMAEFDLQSLSLTSALDATLSFETLHPFLPTAPSQSNFPFEISIVAYNASVLGADTADFSAKPLGTVGTFSTAGLTAGSPLSFDVTSFYNGAIDGGKNLAFRLAQTDELGTTEPLGYTFDNFRLDLNYESAPSGVPEPTSLTLAGLGIVILAWGRGRRVRRSPRAAQPNL